MVEILGRLFGSYSENRKSKTCTERRPSIEDRKWLALSVFISTLVVVGAVAEAQQTGKIARIGYLDPSTAAGRPHLLEALRQELRKLGWIEGKNLAIEYRHAEGRNDRLPELAADLVRRKVDLIVVSATPAAVAAKSATTAIPIVMTNVGDPVGVGLVASLARPGGNITGFAGLSPELNGKRLEILNDSVSKLTRVGFLRASGSGDFQLKEIRPAALALKLKLEEIETEPGAGGLESAFQTAKQKQVGAITTMSNPSFFAERRRIAAFAARYLLPAIYTQKEYVDEGGLMSYGTDFVDLFRRSAHYVDKILKGANPADLPVQQATQIEFIVNLKAAQQIGLTIPSRVLERANHVIK
jgi:putative ABC transport system substrate-binding protein